MSLKRVSVFVLWVAVLLTFGAILMYSDRFISEQLMETHWEYIEEGAWDMLYYFQVLLISCLCIRGLMPEIGILVLPFLTLAAIWMGAWTILAAVTGNWVSVFWVQTASVLEAGIIAILLYRIPGLDRDIDAKPFVNTGASANINPGAKPDSAAN